MTQAVSPADSLELLAFATDADTRPARPAPFLCTLASVALRPEPVLLCVVLPQAAQVAHTIATLATLRAIREEYPELLRAYVENVREGATVSVLPHGYVYAYAGRMRHSGYDFFRLQVLDGKGASSRTVEASEILRLQLTSKSAPRGKQNTDLGTMELCDLDTLLGTSTFGNRAVFRTRVFLNANRSAYESFARDVSVRPDAGSGPECEYLIHDVLPWGRVTDEGQTIPVHGDGRPALAVTQNVDCIAAALRDNASGVAVLVDGAKRMQNVQPYVELAERHRVVVIADITEREHIEHLAQAGAHVWQPDPREVCLGIEGNRRIGLGREVVRAARVARSLKIRIVPSESEDLDRASAALREAERLIGPEGHEEVRQAIGDSFSLLLALAEWILPADVEAHRGVTDRFRRITSRLQPLLHFQEPAVVRAMNNALTAIARFTDRFRDEPSGKLDALAELLDRSAETGKRLLIVTRTPEAAKALAEALSDKWKDATVIPARAVTSAEYDSIVICSWLRSQLVERVLGMYTAPEVHLLGYAHERSWFSGLVSRHDAASRRWFISDAGRRRDLGLPELPSGLQELPGRTSQSATDPSDPDAVLLDLLRLEGIRRSGRKGSGSEPGGECEARYVGFVGATYAFLTETHRTLRITGLLSGNGAGPAIAQVLPAELRIGDLVLFRLSGATDIIAQLAEYRGRDEYRNAKRLASHWRNVLVRIGTTPRLVHEKLSRAGISQQQATIASWMYDPDRIGPQGEEDLRIIGRVAQDSFLVANASAIYEAIRTVRGYHQAAGQHITKLLLAELPRHLSEIGDEERLLELDFGAVIAVHVDEIGPQPERRYPNEVNRLLRDDRFA